MDGDGVFMIYEAEPNPDTNSNRHRIDGTVVTENGRQVVRFGDVYSEMKPVFNDPGLYGNYVGASLTARAFDSAYDGLGKWLVTVAVWLFALSTIISWSYYGEQGIVFLAGQKAVLPYKFVYCLLIVVATIGLVTTDAELDNVTGMGTGVMVWANLPIVILFGSQAMRAYRHYVRRLKSGELDSGQGAAPTLDDILADKRG